MKKDFWKNKKVFITGINGFVGGNLAKVLLDNGANVFGLIRNIDQKSFYTVLAYQSLWLYMKIIYLKV